jgi:hypothetical protein
VTVRGAGLGGGPAAAPIELRLAPDLVVTLAEQAGGAHLPRALVASGQRVWGELAGGVPWLVAVDAAAVPPRCRLRLTPSQADALLAQAANGQPWSATCERLTVEDLGAPPPARRLLLRANGTVGGEVVAMLRRLSLGGGRVPVRALEAEITLRPGPGPGAVRVAMRRLDLEVNGAVLSVGALVERQLNLDLDRRLPHGLPGWVPLDAALDLAVGR